MSPKPKKPKRRQQTRFELLPEALPALAKCYGLMVAEAGQTPFPKRNQVIAWALRKCAAEAERG